MKIKTTNLTAKEKETLYQILFDRFHYQSTGEMECLTIINILKKTKCEYKELESDFNYHFKN